MADVQLNEPINVLDLRSVFWVTDPLRQWILRNVVDGRFISEPAAEVEDTRPGVPNPTVHRRPCSQEQVSRDSVRQHALICLQQSGSRPDTIWSSLTRSLLTL